MNNSSMPQPMPRKKMSLGVKILLLGLQCGLLMIGALAIWIMSYSRDERNKDVAREITKDWGSSVVIDGPTAMAYKESTEGIRPETFNCVADVKSQSLHRNIYEAEVFEADIMIDGTFSKKKLASQGNYVYLVIKLPTAQLSEVPMLNFGSIKSKWTVSDDYIYTIADISTLPEVIDYSTVIHIRGSQSILVRQIGEKSIVSVNGNAKNPSFYGGRLPRNRELNDSTFKAKWINEKNTSTFKKDEHLQYAEARFLVGVDRYQKVSRSLKYAFLIIILTYISVLFTEIIMKRNIPLLNYFLIGAALILFYSLLLSFSEHLSFGFSYLIAACMTVALISGYMWKMLTSRKVGIVMGGILTGLYLSCYILLSLSTCALLLGSLILFIALGAMMYGSLQVKR